MKELLITYNIKSGQYKVYDDNGIVNNDLNPELVDQYNKSDKFDVKFKRI